MNNKIRPKRTRSAAGKAPGDFAYPRVKSGVKLAGRAKLCRLLARHACEFLEKLQKLGVLKFGDFISDDVHRPELSRVDWCEPLGPRMPHDGIKTFREVVYYLHPLFRGQVLPTQLFQILEQHSDAAVGKALKLAVEQRIVDLHLRNVSQYPARRKIKEPELRLAVYAREAWARSLGVLNRWGKS